MLERIPATSRSSSNAENWVKFGSSCVATIILEPNDRNIEQLVRTVSQSGSSRVIWGLRALPEDTEMLGHGTLQSFLSDWSVLACFSSATEEAGNKGKVFIMLSIHHAQPREKLVLPMSIQRAFRVSSHLCINMISVARSPAPAILYPLYAPAS